MNTRDPIPHYDVVISGMSLAGMATAIEAMQAGRSVLIINNRDDHFTLSQRIVLAEQPRKYLLGMLQTHEALQTEDAKFVHKLTHDVTLSLKNIQKYLYRRMHETASLVNATFCVTLNSSIDEVFLDEGLVTIAREGYPEPSQVNFSILIGADGVGRHALNMLNESASSTQQIHLVSLKQPSHHVFAEIIFTNCPEDFLKNKYVYIASTPYGNAALLSKNMKHHNNRSFYVAKFLCSLPDKVLAINLAEERENAIHLFIRQQTKTILAAYNIDTSDVLINISMRKMKNNRIVKRSPRLFDVDVKQCKQAYTSNTTGIHNCYSFIAAGDCYRTAEYQQGHGGNHALLHAQFLGRVFRGKQSLSAYEKFAEGLAKRVHAGSAKLRLFAPQVKEQVDKRLEQLSNNLPKLAETCKNPLFER